MCVIILLRRASACMLAIQVCLYKCSWDIQMIMRGDSISRSAYTSILVLLSYLVCLECILEKHGEKKDDFLWIPILINFMNEWKYCIWFLYEKTWWHYKMSWRSKEKLMHFYFNVFNFYVFNDPLVLFVWESIILYDWTFFPQSKSKSLIIS